MLNLVVRIYNNNMRKILMFVLLFIGIVTQAQSDKIHKHNGDVISGKIVRINEKTITFIYDNESSEQIIGKYAVEKITHGSSGREEEISERIVVNGEQDWDKIIVFFD